MRGDREAPRGGAEQVRVAPGKPGKGPSVWSSTTFEHPAPKAPVISVLHERDQIATAQERKVLGISQEKVTVSFQLRPSR